MKLAAMKNVNEKSFNVSLAMKNKKNFAKDKTITQ